MHCVSAGKDIVPERSQCAWTAQDRWGIAQGESAFGEGGLEGCGGLEDCGQRTLGQPPASHSARSG